MTYYGMWFNNISNPIISEGFIDFGIFGVTGYGIILAIFAKMIEKSLNSNFV